MATAREWSVGYARQAAADMATWDALRHVAGVPECHRLLFLQMACEKLVKAHLCRAGTAPQSLQSSHAYTAKTLPAVVRQQLTFVGGSSQTQQRLVGPTRRLAAEIELLAPAVRRDGRRPDNCEYPWEDATGALHVPVDWQFIPTDLLTAHAGRAFLKLVRAAIARYAR